MNIGMLCKNFLLISLYAYVCMHVCSSSTPEVNRYDIYIFYNFFKFRNASKHILWLNVFLVLAIFGTVLRVHMFEFL